jgi:hypothetical protein
LHFFRHLNPLLTCLGHSALKVGNVLFLASAMSALVVSYSGRTFCVRRLT